MKVPAIRTIVLPKQTLALLLLTLLLHLFPDEHQLLYFNREQVLAGDWWRLLSGHFIHIDATHLFWNSLALLILGGCIEQHTRRLLLPVFIAGVVAVDLLLMSALPQVETYCGLSGVLNSLVVLVLWLYWQQTHHGAVVVSGVLCFAKPVVELTLGIALVAELSWPPVVTAHLAGLAAGIVTVAVTVLAGRTPGNSQRGLLFAGERRAHQGV